MKDDAGTYASTCGYQEDKSGLDPPDDALDYLRSVYCDPLQPTNTRLKAASIAIEYERPRLAVMAQVDGRDLASLLDAANERIAKMRAGQKVIEAKVSPIEDDILDPPKAKPILPVPDRRYRRG